MKGPRGIFRGVLRGEAAGEPETAGDRWKGDCGAEPAEGECLSPEMNLKSLCPGAIGDRSASLARAGFSVYDVPDEVCLHETGVVVAAEMSLRSP